MIKENLKYINERIHFRCEMAGRSISDVKLMLATKSVDIDKIQTCIENDQTYFGENRVQDLLPKMQNLDSSNICWDFIGHLQSNKAKEIVNQVNLIHSVDRKSLVKELEKRATQRQKILIEVNTSFEAAKSGIDFDGFAALLNQVLESKHLDFCGLMTVALNSNHESTVRKCFQSLYKLRAQAARVCEKNESDLELSMGMSSDYEWAILEGATIIRLGSIVFGPRI